MKTPAAPAGVPARRAAYRALRRVHEADAWASPAVDAALRSAHLPPRDRAFAANLAFQTLRWEGTLDWALGTVLDRPVDDVEPAVRDVLRMGAWQLLFGRVPDRAAVGTAVDVAKAEGLHRAGGFVNGVLRGLARRRPAWPAQDSDEGLGLALGYPPWIVAAARQRFGGRARAVLEAGNEPPGLTLRTVGDRDDLIAELRSGGLDAGPGRWTAAAVRVPGASAAGVPAVVEGRATPQDEASILVGHALRSGVRAETAPRVFDACAGPGGKATHLLQQGCRVLAADLYPHRAALVTGLARRLALGDGLLTVVADTTRPLVRASGADAALVDAPCTGLGVVRRRPELRWRRDPTDPGRLAQLQLALLRRAADAVRTGGLLLYSACTWTEEETSAVVAAFLDLRRDYRAEEPALEGAGARHRDDPGVQLAPDTDGTDGMYVACIRRNAG